MTGFAPPQGDPPSIAMVTPARLKVDPSYQRSLDSRASAKLIRAIADTWDWRLCVPLIVSQRADGLYVIDGQHRRQAAAMRGDITYLPCSISIYASPAEEARLFVAANRSRRAISRVDDFRAAVAAGQPEHVEIDRLVRAAGLSIARHANAKALSPGEISFTSGLLTALRRRGAEAVGLALDVMGAAFAGQQLDGSGAIFAGLLEIGRAGRTVSRDRLVAVLSGATAADWANVPEVRAAIGGEGRGLAMKRAIVVAVAATPPPAAMAPPPPPPPPKPRAEPVPSAAPVAALPPRVAGPSTDTSARASKARKVTPAEQEADFARAEAEATERQLAKVRAGAGIAPVRKIRTADPERTLGGVGSAML